MKMIKNGAVRIVLVLFALVIAGCHGKDGGGSRPVSYIGFSGSWSGIVDGKQATLDANKSGDRVSGTIIVDGELERFIGFDRTTVVTIGSKSYNLELSGSRTMLNIVSGATGHFSKD